MTIRKVAPYGGPRVKPIIIAREATVSYNHALESWLPAGVYEAAQAGDRRAEAVLMAHRRFKRTRHNAHWRMLQMAIKEFSHEQK